MYLYHNIENDLVIDVKDIYHRSQIIKQMKQKFTVFGYHEIQTSAFEPYDLYVEMNGTINQQEMMKSIDNTGRVLVLRPDVTIPLTQQIALNNKEIHEDLRYFYVTDVFRQAQDEVNNRENTQAGVEYFGNAGPEADAEIIALSIQSLQDINLKNVKIELGHAGFFKQLIVEMDLEKQDLQELQQYIQAKNVTEIDQLLQQLSVKEDIKKIVTSLPFLYGEPMEVIKKAKELPLSKQMLATLDNIYDIYQGLEAYGVHHHIVIDLSLINHMDYYSDMIFQGFIENVGKPILMGGRYNTLANQFGADIPAIGFACDLDLLLQHIPVNTMSEMNKIDMCIYYEKINAQKSLELATQLRKQNMQVVLYPKNSNQSRIPETNYTLEIENNTYILKRSNEKKTFQSTTEVMAFFHD